MHYRKFFRFVNTCYFWSISRFWSKFYGDFFCCDSRDVSCIVLNILMFGPRWRFCKGYSPCIIAKFSDFGTPGIFQILGVFGVNFCVGHFCYASRNVLSIFLNILIFDPNWRFFKGYSSCIIANFSDFWTLVIFGILGVLEWIFAYNISVVALETFFAWFWTF